MAEVRDDGTVKVQRVDWDIKRKDSVCLTVIESIADSAKTDDQKLQEIHEQLRARREGKDYYGL